MCAYNLCFSICITYEQESMCIIFVVQFMHIFFVSCILYKYFLCFMHNLWIYCLYVNLYFTIFKIMYIIFYFIVVLNDSSLHIFSYNVCWQILVLYFCSYIFLFGMIKENGGSWHAWPESDTRTGLQCRAVRQWRVCGLRRGERVMIWFVGSSARVRELEIPERIRSTVVTAWLYRSLR